MTQAAARHFARVARDYGALRARWPLRALRAQEHRAIRELIHIRPGQRVVDAGCGGGEILAWLRRCGAEPLGIDLVWLMAVQASQVSGAPVVVQDMEELGLRPVFDWALCIGALEFTADPARVLRGLAGALTDGGRVGLLFPRRSPLAHLYVAYHSLHGLPIRLFSKAEMRAHLAAAGLEPEARWRDCALSTVCVARPRVTAR